MSAIRPAWNWLRLILLLVSSYLAFSGFGFCFPFMYTPADETCLVYPWTAGLSFSAITAIVFLLCIDDPSRRRAAFAAFGISALLTGPLYIVNMDRLAHFSPAGSPWTSPHLPLALTTLCWIGSFGLFVWWLRRSPESPAWNARSVLLFGGLTLILLVIPWVTNRCGVESMRIPADLPTSADAFRQTEDTLTHFLVQNEAASVADGVGYLAQWISLSISVPVFGYFALVWAITRFTSKTTAPSAFPFPSRIDTLPLLVFLLGGLIFGLETSLFNNLSQQMTGVESTMGRSVFSMQVGLIVCQLSAGIIYIAGTWRLWQRIKAASQLRFTFTLLVLIASLAVGFLALDGPNSTMNLVGVAALFLFSLKAFAFFNAHGRSRWTASSFASPVETIRSFAVEGSVTLAMLGAVLMAVAIELAYVSVFAIHYFIAWGTAIKPLHGVAPVEQIVPGIAQSLAPVSIILGPAYFAGCLYVGILTVLLASFVYWLGSGCVQFIGRLTGVRKTPPASLAATP